MAKPSTKEADVSLTDPRNSFRLISEDAPNPKAPRIAMSAHVAARIRELIFDGTLKSGQRIPQDALAADLGVSRLPVREALITLETEGLVTSEPHRGTFVVPIMQEDIDDHYRMYGMIQGLAANRAARRLNDITLARLWELHKTMCETQSKEEFHNLNWEFHALITQAGGSRRLLSVLRQLGHNLPRTVYENPSGSIDEANTSHARIMEALQSRDGAAADQASVEHTVAEGRHVVEKLREAGVLTDT
ncbi:GntR family transcriptional regulator [Arthrobacter sp. Y81]|uniref:GntR family transcriptional regulator n=1 Tax=Arthrobacter sp. Y81 TaxID=2058897 RepID=UPI001C665D32|nr:GntR family transcriptional regulator [Arthrobacter sp. Y81]